MTNHSGVQNRNKTGGPFSWGLWERLIQTAFVITIHEEGDKQSARNMLDRVIKEEEGQYSLPDNLLLSCAIQS